MTKQHLASWATAAVVCCMVLEVSSSVANGSSQSSPPFLGFQSGEERHYALGPPERLYRGEVATWSIRLRELVGDRAVGVFELDHLWERGALRIAPATGTIMRIKSDGEMRVNADGFPLEVRFQTERQLAGMGVEVYTIRYRFEDGRFRKRVILGGNDFEHSVMVQRTGAVDLSIPKGMYVFASVALDCLLRLPRGAGRLTELIPTPPPARLGLPSGTPVGARIDAGASDCREPLFSNPGLLSLMLPALWEHGTGEYRFAMLTPAGLFGMPGVGGGLASSLGVSATLTNRPFDAKTATSPQTNSDIETLRYLERVQVEVGTRVRDAWRFEGMRELESIYVDDEGVVLRVDLAGWLSRTTPRAGSTAEVEPHGVDERRLWIRLLFPSEY